MTAARPLWALATLLLAGVAAELLGALPSQDAAQAPAAALSRPAAAPVGQVVDWAQIALARPLFSSARRPDQAAVVRGTVATRAGLPRLAGIMVTPDGRRALFAPADSGRATVVAVGGAVGGWTVEAIRADGIVLTGPDGRVDVRPSYSNAPARPQPMAAPAAQPLLPPLVQTDTAPFDTLTQPSGAAIFGHATPPPLPGAPLSPPVPALPPGAPPP